MTPNRSKIIRQLDKLVSDEVKRRVKGKCARCQQVRANMGCSHYFSRRYIGTRWNFDNLDWLCWLPCHNFFEHDKQGEYTDLMIKKLGRAKFNRMKIKAYSANKFSTQDLQLLLQLFEQGKFD